MFINKTQYPYTVQWFDPASLNVWRGFWITGPAASGVHAYSRAIFCSNDLVCPAVTSMATLSIKNQTHLFTSTLSPNSTINPQHLYQICNTSKSYSLSQQSHFT